MGFEIFKDKDGKFSYRLKTNIGQIIMTGLTYATEEEAREISRSVKENATRSNFAKIETADGRRMFLLKNKKGQTIGKSSAYWSPMGVENGIQIVINTMKQTTPVAA